MNLIRGQEPSFQYRDLNLLILSVILIGAVLTLPHTATGANAGEKAFQEGDYDAAVEYYQSVLEDREIPEASYNLGNALYKQGKLEESVRAFERSLAINSPGEKAQVMYNLGNAMANAQKYQQSAAFYQRALELQPDDRDAKYNLELIRRKMQQQQKDQNRQGNDQQKDNDQRKDQKNNRQQQDKSDNRKEEQQQGDRQNQGESQQDQTQNERREEEQQQQQREQEEGEQSQQREKQSGNEQQNGEQQRRPAGSTSEEKMSLDRKEAAQILNALRLNQDKVMKAQIQKKLKRVKTDKDW